MSRTDKDRPWQIRAEDRSGAYNGAYFYHCDWTHYREGGCGDRCGWTLPHHHFCHPPHLFRRFVWFGPERRREREGLRAMAKEWNANYYLEDEDFYSPHHRHGAVWDWC